MGLVENQSEVAVGPSIQCINRLYELPMFASALATASGMYEKVKESNLPLVNRTLGAAEATAKFAVSQASPFVGKLPIGYVDALACKGLDALEGTVPAVKKEPTEIMADAKAYVLEKTSPTFSLLSRIKTYGVVQVESALNQGKGYVGVATDYGKSKVVEVTNSPFAVKTLKGVDTVLMAATASVDKYMPGELHDEEDMDLENYEPKWADAELESLAHTAALTNKLRHQIYRVVVFKVQEVQKNCGTMVDSIVHPSQEFVDYVKNQVSSGSQMLADKTVALWNENKSISVVAQRLIDYLRTNYESIVRTAPVKKE